jgi:hypothetical protein
VARREIARERDRVRLELGGGNCLADDAERVGLLAGHVLAAQRNQRDFFTGRPGMHQRRGDGLPERAAQHFERMPSCASSAENTMSWQFMMPSAPPGSVHPARS